MSLLTRVEPEWLVTYGDVKLQQADGRWNSDVALLCTIHIYNSEFDRIRYRDNQSKMQSSVNRLIMSVNQIVSPTVKKSLEIM